MRYIHSLYNDFSVLNQQFTPVFKILLSNFLKGTATLYQIQLMSAVCGPFYEMSSINNELDLWVKLLGLNLMMLWTGFYVSCPMYFNIFKKKRNEKNLNESY